MEEMPIILRKYLSKDNEGKKEALTIISHPKKILQQAAQRRD